MELLLEFHSKKQDIDSSTKLSNELDAVVCELNERNNIIRFKMLEVVDYYFINLIKERQSIIENSQSLSRTLTVLLISVVLIVLIIINNYFKIKKQKHDILKGSQHREFLIRELHHRVKNNLQLITSFARIDYKEDSYFDFENFETRIHSLALVHSLLYKSSNIGTVNLKGYIDKILENLKRAMWISIRFNIQQILLVQSWSLMY